MSKDASEKVALLSEQWRNDPDMEPLMVVTGARGDCLQRDYQQIAGPSRQKDAQVEKEKLLGKTDMEDQPPSYEELNPPPRYRKHVRTPMLNTINC